MSQTVISVENLYKEYKLGVISHGTLHRDMQSWWSRVRGKEDPNSLISAHHSTETDADSFLALNDVSFDVKEGEILGIIGKNGAGKSTLLKVLSRITAPTSGQIKIKGRVGSLLEVGTGFHPELTGRENIFLNGAILGMNKREIRSKIDEIIDFAGIERHIDTPVKRYSSGMHVRLAFSVAAHLDPEILIVDEVLAVGDVDFQKKCLGKMKDISKGQGRTVLFVSHNMGSISSLCNKTILLKFGKLQSSGETEKIIRLYFNNQGNLGKTTYQLTTDNNLLHPFIQRVKIIGLEDPNKSIFTRGEKVTLEINFKNPKEYRGLNLSAKLSEKNLGIIFTTTLYDSNVKYFHQKIWLKGEYTVSLNLPTDFLRSGKYVIDLELYQPLIQGLHIFPEQIKFTLIDDNSPVFQLGEGREGSIIPIIKWSVGK